MASFWQKTCTSGKRKRSPGREPDDREVQEEDTLVEPRRNGGSACHRVGRTGRGATPTRAWPRAFVAGALLGFGLGAAIAPPPPVYVAPPPPVYVAPPAPYPYLYYAPPPPRVRHYYPYY